MSQVQTLTFDNVVIWPWLEPNGPEQGLFSSGWTIGMDQTPICLDTNIYIQIFSLVLCIHYKMSASNLDLLTMWPWLEELNGPKHDEYSCLEDERLGCTRSRLPLLLSLELCFPRLRNSPFFCGIFDECVTKAFLIIFIRSERKRETCASRWR